MNIKAFYHQNSRVWDGHTERKTEATASDDGTEALNTDDGDEDGSGGLPLSRRDVMKSMSAAVGAASVGPLSNSIRAAPDVLPTDQHMHWGEQEVMFIGVYFEDTAAPGPIEEYQRAMFDSDSELGADEYTVQEYMDIVSDGHFSISPGPWGLAGWYQLSMTADEFNSSGGLGPATEEALEKATADGYDITPYGEQENDPQVVIVFQGGGGGIAWSGWTTEHEGVTINGTCKAPARDTADQQDINYTSHEYLHLHGLTDLYQKPGTGNMGLMGAGPLVDLIPWSKVNVDLDQTPEPTGWDETTAIHPTDQAGILPPQSVENQFYTVVSESNGADDDPDFHKYYYLAYSDRSGVDATFDSDQEGLVVWHHYQSMGVEWGAKNLQFETPPADGSRFQATQSKLDSSLIETDVILDTVTDDYNSLQFNDPPHRSVPAGDRSAYAVDVNVTRPSWLPDLGDRENQDHGDVIYTDDIVDARVSWADDTNDITLRLIDPTGTEHAVSDDYETGFTVVRSDPVTGNSGFDGGWKLVEEVDTSDAVDYYRTTNYPTYELATSASIDSASLGDGEVTATVSLAFGDDSDYSYDPAGPPSASQFEITFDSTTVENSAVSVTEIDESTYDLMIDVGASNSGEHTVSIAFIDEKVGVSNRISPVPEVTVKGGDGGDDGGGDDNEEGTSSGSGPGFGIGGTVGALTVGGLLRAIRSDDES